MKIKILQFIFYKSKFTIILPIYVTNYGTLIRKLLKNGVSGNLFTPPLPPLALGKRDSLATEMFHVRSVIPPPQSWSIRHWAPSNVAHSLSFSRPQHVPVLLNLTTIADIHNNLFYYPVASHNKSRRPISKLALHNNCRICSVHFEHVFRISRKTVDLRNWRWRTLTWCSQQVSSARRKSRTRKY